MIYLSAFALARCGDGDCAQIGEYLIGAHVLIKTLILLRLLLSRARTHTHRGHALNFHLSLSVVATYPSGFAVGADVVVLIINAF